MDWSRWSRVVGLALITKLGWAGPLQAVDSAEVTVSLSIPKLVSISQLQDARLGEWSGAGDLAVEQQLCVWSSTRGYSLSATAGEAANPGFVLTSADGASLVYHVFWNDGYGFQQLVAGQTVGGLSAPARSTTCQGGGDSVAQTKLRVAVYEPALAAAIHGDYQGQLRLELAAE